MTLEILKGIRLWISCSGSISHHSPIVLFQTLLIDKIWGAHGHVCWSLFFSLLCNSCIPHSLLPEASYDVARPISSSVSLQVPNLEVFFFFSFSFFNPCPQIRPVLSLLGIFFPPVIPLHRMGSLRFSAYWNYTSLQSFLQSHFFRGSLQTHVSMGVIRKTTLLTLIALWYELSLNSWGTWLNITLYKFWL